MAMIIIRENIRTIFTLSRMEPPSFCASIITQEDGLRKGKEADFGRCAGYSTRPCRIFAGNRRMLSFFRFPFCILTCTVLPEWIK